jgi:hypothetical protein
MQPETAEVRTEGGDVFFCVRYADGSKVRGRRSGDLEDGISVAERVSGGKVRRVDAWLRDPNDARRWRWLPAGR